jgi:AraC-like DNA-binding protein
VIYATPTLKLKPYVRCLWQLDVGPGHDVLPGWIAPDGQIEIVFHTGVPGALRPFGSEHWAVQPQAFVLPMRRGAVQLATSGRDCIVALRIDPVVASVLLRRPMGELWDALTPLSDLLGSEADALVDALARAAPAARFGIIERWIEAGLRDWTCSLDDLKAIYARLFWRGDGTPLAKVAPQLGVTTRSLRRWTANTAGLSPKEIELMGRILRSCALLREQPTMPISSVALEIGFYDQPAFSHAFSQQVGLPPAAFKALPLVFYEREHG